MMKKLGYGIAVVYILGILTIGLTTIAGQFGDYGGGYSTNVTTTAVSVTFGTDEMKEVSLFVYGGSTQVVYVLPDCQPVTLATAVSNNTAMPIRGGLSYTFKERPMTNICLQAKAGIGTVTVDIAARRK
jgi:hypothetical protein